VDGVGAAYFIYDQIPLAIVDFDHKCSTVEPELLANLKLPNLYG
jgi:hypothetical protein